MATSGVPRVVLGVRRFLAGPHGPAPGSHGLVAVSGGADSTALALALHRLAPPRGLTITLAHVNHGLRATSDDDARWVERFGAGLGLAVATARAPVDGATAIEARARRARYAALDRMATEAGATWIATAHTRDDQVETILMRLARGADRRGLGGMTGRRGAVVRPLLTVSRADVRWYLGSLGVQPLEDPSNGDLRFTRNRVRHLVVPVLEREIMPDMGRRLTALAGRLRDEDEYLATVANTRSAELLDGEALSIQVALEPVALARRIVRGWLEHVGGRAIGSRHVEAVLQLTRGRARRSVAVPGGRIVRDGTTLRRWLEARGTDASADA